MVLTPEDKVALEMHRDHERDGGVAFLADILCKIVYYLEAAQEAKRDRDEY